MLKNRKCFTVLALLFALVFSAACDNNSQNDAKSAIPHDIAARYFAKLYSLFEADGGELWGMYLHTPFIFVDAETRQIAANKPDPQGILVRQGDLYVGTLPGDIPAIYSTPYFSGQYWAMLPWEMMEQFFEMGIDPLRTMAHLAFHVLQPTLFGATSGWNTSHMEEMDARISIQLEINALIHALKSTGEERRRAIHDALSIRAERRYRHPEGKVYENIFEIIEGTAQYLEFKMIVQDMDMAIMEARMWLIEMRNAPTLSGIFGYWSGALYGLLLDEMGDSWRENLRYDSDLGQLLQDAAGITSLALLKELDLAVYGYDDITAFEAERFAFHDGFLYAIRDSFTNEPTLRIPWEFRTGMNVNPMQFFELPGWGFIYGPDVVFIGDFGQLVLYGGFFVLHHETGYVMVLAENVEIENGDVVGLGWRLQLNDGFTVGHGADGGLVVYAG